MDANCGKGAHFGLGWDSVMLFLLTSVPSLHCHPLATAGVGSGASMLSELIEGLRVASDVYRRKVRATAWKARPTPSDVEETHLIQVWGTGRKYQQDLAATKV